MKQVLTGAELPATTLCDRCGRSEEEIE